MPDFLSFGTFEASDDGVAVVVADDADEVELEVVVFVVVVAVTPFRSSTATINTVWKEMKTKQLFRSFNAEVLWFYGVNFVTLVSIRPPVILSVCRHHQTRKKAEKSRCRAYSTIGRPRERNRNRHHLMLYLAF